jgi:hypothetical protein
MCPLPVPELVVVSHEQPDAIADQVQVLPVVIVNESVPLVLGTVALEEDRA